MSVIVHRDRPATVWSWAFYDWANSAFTTLVVTFVYATYFTQAMAPDEVTGTAWWSRAVAITAILTALLSPIIGAAADRAGRRKRFLLISAIICIGATAALSFIAPGGTQAAVTALLLFVVANLAFEMGNVLYNSFLPAIASPRRSSVCGPGMTVSSTKTSARAPASIARLAARLRAAAIGRARRSVWTGRTIVVHRSVSNGSRPRVSSRSPIEITQCTCGGTLPTEIPSTCASSWLWRALVWVSTAIVPGTSAS